jgi:hypothetical protein
MVKQTWEMGKGQGWQISFPPSKIGGIGQHPGFEQVDFIGVAQDYMEENFENEASRFVEEYLLRKGFRLMTVSKTTDYWTSRLDGNDPSAPVGMQNEQFTGSAGAANGLNWTINSDNGYGNYTITPTTNEYTLWVSFSYTDSTDLPADGTVLAELDNGTHQVQLQADGTAGGLKMVGATTETFTGLDLIMADIDAIPTVMRLTLSSTGQVKAYLFDIAEDDNGAILNKSLTGATGASKTAQWGNSDGEVTWYAVYLTTMGAFNPDEMVTSNYSNVTLIQTAFGIIDVLKTARSYNLKNVVQPSGILYGYDISSNMAVRQTPCSSRFNS